MWAILFVSVARLATIPIFYFQTAQLCENVLSTSDPFHPSMANFPPSKGGSVRLLIPFAKSPVTAPLQGSPSPHGCWTDCNCCHPKSPYNLRLRLVPVCLPDVAIYFLARVLYSRQLDAPITYNPWVLRSPMAIAEPTAVKSTSDPVSCAGNKLISPPHHLASCRDIVMVWHPFT